MAMGVWRKATSKLFDLEAKIANQVHDRSALLVHAVPLRRLESLNAYACFMRWLCSARGTSIANVSLQLCL